MTQPAGYIGKPSREHFQESLRKREKTSAIDNASQLRQIAQGEVVAKLLTRDPNWDVFLSIIAAQIEFAKTGEKDFHEEMMDPHLHPDLALDARQSALLCRERAKALEWVLAIPKAIIEDADKAKELLGKIEFD